jgi:hypothetical protein
MGNDGETCSYTRPGRGAMGKRGVGVDEMTVELFFWW